MRQRKLHIVSHRLSLQVLRCVYPDIQFYVHQYKPGELQNLSGKPFLKLYHQSSQHAKYSVALQTSTHSAKLHLKRIFLCFLKNNLRRQLNIFTQLFYLLSISGGPNEMIQKAKKDLQIAGSAVSSLSLSGSGLCHACPQFVLALNNFTRQLAVFWPKVVFPH